MNFTHIKPITWMDWVAARECHTERADGFAGTFFAKANTMNLWPSAMGIKDYDGNLMAGIIVRVSKRKPLVANLQLLHTFSPYRRQGLAKLLTEYEFEHAIEGETAEYFRVSSEEEAVPFYRSLGFKFWGRQKSGSLLSMFRIVGPTIAEGAYDLEDPTTRQAVHSKMRGGVVELFKDGPC